MVEDDVGKLAQPGASFPHTCLLYSPLRKSTSNNPYIGFLPEAGSQQGGTFGAFKCGRQTQQRLLTTKIMGPMEFINLLNRTLSDCRDERVNDISATQCATQRLLGFEPLHETYDSYRREMSEIYIVTYENEFPDQLVVEHPEPGIQCAVL